MKNALAYAFMNAVEKTKVQTTSQNKPIVGLVVYCLEKISCQKGI